MPDEPQFFEKIAELERVLSRHRESSSALTDIRDLLTDRDVCREFFKTLQGPDWIVPLRESGYFDDPPEATKVAGGGVQYTAWPASAYLARMASQAPEEVADILAKIETDNAFVIGNILDAALAMPPEVATSLVPTVCRAAREGTLWIHFKDASDLCVRLAEGGEAASALQLADALFTPTFEEGEEKPKREDAYWYKDGLKKVTPVLTGANAREFLPKLCDWLKTAVEAKRRVDRDSGKDYSDVWRPAIEEHEQNRDYDFAGAIVGYVREGFERAIRDKILSLDEALGILEGHHYLIFMRLSLHLIGEFAEQNPDLARETMLSRGLFEEHGCKHEHAMLLGKRFTMLDSNQQAKWLQWVQEIPTERLATVLHEPNDRNMSQRQSDYWRFQRLHWIREYLTGENKQFYQEMLTKCGEPEMADLNFWSGPAHWGHETPMAMDQLNAMTFEEAVEAVSKWKPEERGFRTPDIEGLASTFEQYVATDPEQFSKKAYSLKEQPAPFVRKFIYQMGKAIGARTEIDLPAVLDLCDWVVSRPVDERTVSDEEQGALTDKDWQWTRDDISGLLKTVCSAMDNGVPRYPPEDLRERMWGLIEALCYDRAESYVDRDISKEDPRLHDYLNFAINAPRGKALEAALEYARWRANHIKKADGKAEIVPDGFDAMPEVRAMLQWQTAKENRTVEAMAVIGSRIGLIYWIDKKWLEANATQLFPLEQMKKMPSVPEAWAAWNAFLVWSSTYSELHRIFKSQFAYAIEEVAHITSTGGHREEPVRRLGEHLILLYGRGQLGLDDNGGLLRRFIENATPDLRRHAISFVGETLDGDEEVPDDVIQRFMALWEYYWTGPGKKDAEEKPDAWLFGWWFSCGRFPEQWALDQLEQLVEVAPMLEPDHAIAEKLAEIAHVDIDKSVRILDRMIRGDQEGWRIHSCRDEARQILERAMQSSGSTKEQAMNLINYLGRRGYTEFGELLHD